MQKSLTQEDLVRLGVMSTAVTLIIAGNTLALRVFLRKSFRMKKSNYLLINLTFADLFVGIMGIPHIAITSSQVFIEDRWKPVLPILTSFGFSASLAFLVSISLERTYAVFFPMKHRVATSRQYCTFSVITWAMAAVVACLSVEQQDKDIARTLHDRTFLAITIITLIFLGLIVVSYFSIWFKVTFFKPINKHQAWKANSKLAKTLFILTVASLVTWLPRFIYQFMNNAEKPGPTIASHYFYLVILSNSFINIIVFTLRMPLFRSEIKSIARSLCGRQIKHGVRVEHCSRVNQSEPLKLLSARQLSPKI
ncbi:predicted protein [Nematostella vectensis]|uniref:G-protein coupled receptors family 1 profile domain-containing protein n=1 Tax=Nematostella vectensis TaxID=45351 RepID=A7S497_NEMVE|nr:predicted protein [Nematostella vectensis]|eukprot:XP_001633541.1 predicted protein [Nematostella vectensis]